MFWLEKNGIGLISNRRCGHSSLCKLFGKTSTDNDYDPDWFVKVPRRVIVLRHPIERMHSAKRLTLMMEKMSTTSDETSPAWKWVKEFVAEETKEQLLEQHYNDHCKFYLHSIEHLDFEIIPFEFLRDYIDDVRFSLPTFSRSKVATEDMFNDVITKEGLDRELELYEKFKTNKVFTVEEFKSSFLS